MRRVAGVLWHPRSTMAEVVRHPAFTTTWIALLLVVAICGAIFLSTPVGRQALVDERVRVIEALGGRVDDATYAALQANPPALVYLTSGGRLLLTPPVTFFVALALMGLARLDRAVVRLKPAMAIAVHASVVLALQQVVATPLHYLRESLTSPTNLSGLLPMLDEGSWPARWLGSIDVFGLWWIWLLAVGLGAATHRPGRGYLWKLLLAYVGIAAIVAGVFAVMTGM
ncbi:MAG: YIP1 family protein [Vicinamibacterales bacterium]